MNYRHAYHAGNYADVLKHVVLRALIESLNAKPAPWCYVDTHAGRGSYALDAPEAGKTQEFQDGIVRLFDATDLPPLLARYRDQIARTAGNENGLRCYPGSPLQVAGLMRADDSAQLCELEPGEATALRQTLRRDRRLHVHERDGYEALGALLPPGEGRGLVLIDPPYEAQEAEYPRIRAALDHAFRRWPNGIYAVWYPIKLRSQVQPFLHALERGPGRRTLCAELLVRAANTPLRLNGAGMVVLNAPWKLDAALAAAMPALARLLVQDAAATAGHAVSAAARRDAPGFRLEWLRSEDGAAAASRPQAPGRARRSPAR